ncbi:hypothetical protein BC939DRAFT_463280, partial [Gamsiella multidivaricata]|uniref:uncharacterized protein n=1 Tax=Gamsiella multidivaricata TaxID=101098 RepID=UPI00221E5A7D
MAVHAASRLKLEIPSEKPKILLGIFYFISMVSSPACTFLCRSHTMASYTCFHSMHPIVMTIIRAMSSMDERALLGQRTFMVSSILFVYLLSGVGADTFFFFSFWSMWSRLMWIRVFPQAFHSS